MKDRFYCVLTCLCVSAHRDLPVLLLIPVHHQQPVWDGLTAAVHRSERWLFSLHIINSDSMLQCLNVHQLFKCLTYVSDVSSQATDGQLQTEKRKSWKNLLWLFNTVLLLDDVSFFRGKKMLKKNPLLLLSSQADGKRAEGNNVEGMLGVVWPKK